MNASSPTKNPRAAVGLLLLAFSLAAAFLLTVPAASADKIISHYSFNTTGSKEWTDSMGRYDGTNVGGTTTAAGKKGTGYYADNAGDYFNITKPVALGGLQHASVCGWVRFTGGTVFAIFNNGASNYRVLDAFYYNYAPSPYKFFGAADLGTSQSYNLIEASTTPDANYTFKCVVYNGTAATDLTKVKLYDGGSLMTGYSHAGLSFPTTLRAPSTTSSIGGKTTLGTGTGFVDEVTIFNISLTAGNVTWLYNAGAGRYWSEVSAAFGSGSTTLNFSVTAKNTTGASLSAFNVTINPEGWSYTTTGGTVTTNLTQEDGVRNITITSAGYYSRTYTNYNLSLNLVGNLTKIVYFSATAADAWSLAAINTFNITIDGHTYANTTGTVRTNLTTTTGVKNITVRAVNHSARTYLNYDLASPLSALLYAYNSLEITARNQSSSATITTFSTTVYNTNYSSTQASTDNRTRYSFLPSGEYTVTVSATGYNPATYTVTVADNSAQTLTAYLAGAGGSSVTIRTTEKSNGESIEDATISQYRLINDTRTLIASKTSDITGRALFSITASVEYEFAITKTGYVSRDFFLTPSYTEYNVALDRLVTTNPDASIDDVTVIIGSSSFVDEHNCSVVVTIASGTGTLESYNLTLTTPTNTTTTTGTNSYGETANLTVYEDSAEYGDTALLTICYASSMNTGARCFSRAFPISPNTHTGGIGAIAEDTRAWGRLEAVLMATILSLLLAGAMAAAGSGAGASVPLGMTGLLVGLGVSAYIGWVGWWTFYIVAFIGVLVIATRAGRSD